MHLRWVFTVETAVIFFNSSSISLNSRLIRPKVLIIKFQPNYLCVPRGLVVKLCPGVSQVPNSTPNISFSLRFFSFLFFFFFSFSFRLVSILGITVLLCFSIYSLQFSDLQIFFSALLAVRPKSFARSCDLRISSLGIYLFLFIYLLFSTIRHPPSAVRRPLYFTDSPARVVNFTQPCLWRPVLVKIMTIKWHHKSILIQLQQILWTCCVFLSSLNNTYFSVLVIIFSNKSYFCFNYTKYFFHSCHE